MYYLRYSVIPAEDHPEREELGEGIVNCWIERDTLAEADQLARQDIRKEKWDVLEREAGEVVTGTDYDEDDDRVTYYRQALTDKEVFVYHHCPRYPVYWVTISVQKGYPSVSAEAHYFLGNEAVMEEDEDPFAPDFWDSYRETAVAEAVAEITGAGYTIAAVVSDQPCNRDELPEDLVPYYDEAEDSGSCLVFIHDDEPSEEDEPGAGV